MLSIKQSRTTPCECEIVDGDLFSFTLLLPLHRSISPQMPFWNPWCTREHSLKTTTLGISGAP